MMAQGGSLSDEDIENVAAYLQTFGAATDKLDAAAVSGMDAAAMCVTCHGAGAADVQPAPPTLSGQHPDYLARVLRQYRDGERAGNVMVAFAATLSEADIAMLARLYASQDGLHTPLDNK
jgi:cytochrome c553